MVDVSQLPYRPCVGLMLINKRGEVFTGQRVDKIGDYWQMPQGGVDEGEDIQAAAFRELYEETGIGADKVELLAIGDEWLKYDIPDYLIEKLWGGRYRGQAQRWFLFGFLGEDSDVRLDLHEREFSCWRWQSIDSLVDNVVPFKVELYECVVERFSADVKNYVVV